MIRALAMGVMALLALLACNVTAMTQADRIRIAEARRIAAGLGDLVWDGWHDAPFAILLIAEDHEYLLYHPQPSEDFAPAGYDSLLQTAVFVRDRQYDPSLQATFPAVGGVPCIVIGQAPKTQASTSTRWVLTVVHEHFHQLQQADPDYYPATARLDLADEDATGMWMLNYPFPYEDKSTSEAFLVMAKRLRAALEADTRGDLVVAARDYLRARTDFTDMLTAKDYRYFSFQVWQEGVARYTELRMARVAAGGNPPGRSFKSLPDYTSYADTRQTMYNHILSSLMTNTLVSTKRPAFYALGAGEALLLDRLGAAWQPLYFTEKFFVEKYFELVPELSR